MRSSVVDLSLSLLITSVSPAKTAKPIEMPFGKGQLWWGARDRVLDGVGIRTRKGNFWVLSGPFESIGRLCCGVCSKRDHSIPSNGTTCDAAFRQKFFDHLLYVVRCSVYRCRLIS